MKVFIVITIFCAFFSDAFARFTSVDPGRQYYSGYTYSSNNPIIIVDPDGNHGVAIVVSGEGQYILGGGGGGGLAFGNTLGIFESFSSPQNYLKSFTSLHFSLTGFRTLLTGFGIGASGEVSLQYTAGPLTNITEGRTIGVSGTFAEGIGGSFSISMTEDAIEKLMVPDLPDLEKAKIITEGLVLGAGLNGGAEVSLSGAVTDSKSIKVWDLMVKFNDALESLTDTFMRTPMDKWFPTQPSMPPPPIND